MYLHAYNAQIKLRSFLLHRAAADPEAGYKALYLERPEVLNALLDHDLSLEEIDKKIVADNWHGNPKTIDEYLNMMDSIQRNINFNKASVVVLNEHCESYRNGENIKAPELRKKQLACKKTQALREIIELHRNKASKK